MMNHTRFSPVVHSLLSVFAVLVLLCPFSPAQAQGARQAPLIIRDTEIEYILKKWMSPVAEAAGLSPGQVNIILVQNSQLNAFVAGGQNIFIYTGLISRSENPGEVIGVIAHEMGHISGGHLVRTRGALESVSYETLLGTLLGIGAAVLTGEGDLAPAIMSGTQSVAQSRFLTFSRVQESSADQAALDYLEKAKMNPAGLVTFMEKLSDEELLPASRQSEYVRTHPLTRNRISTLENGLHGSAYADKPYPEKWSEEHRRMLAKLIGFITPEQVPWRYETMDHSIAADYARAIAAYRENRVDEAIAAINRLLAREPDNPFFHELKGQMLVDFGRVDTALPSYKKAIEIYAEAPLIRAAYAHALIESSHQNEQRLEEAITQLKRALVDEQRSTRIHRLLATAYGRLGQNAMAKLHLAEEAFLKRELGYAKRQAQAALNGLQKGSRAYLRAQDLLQFIDNEAPETD